MTKEECIQVVDAWKIAWNNDPADKATYALWWRYLQSFNSETALKALDWFVAKGGFPPRVADVYRRSVEIETGKVPLGKAEALSQALEVVQANNAGLATPEMHPLIADTMRAMVAKRIRWSPKAFEEEYEQIVAGWYFDRLN